MLVYGRWELDNLAAFCKGKTPYRRRRIQSPCLTFKIGYWNAPTVTAPLSSPLASRRSTRNEASQSQDAALPAVLPGDPTAQVETDTATAGPVPAVAMAPQAVGSTGAEQNAHHGRCTTLSAPIAASPPRSPSSLAKTAPFIVRIATKYAKAAN